MSTRAAPREQSRPRSRADAVCAAARRLSRAVSRLHFADPVTHVYNPLGYAWAMHEAYLQRFARGRKRVLFLGMNPGPWGMAQTGVPFGEVTHVRDWLGLQAAVRRPRNEHPRRPVTGLACERSEVSGARLWGAIASHWKTPARFFRRAFVANYCPLVFMEASARNRTPDKLPASEREPLFRACDRHLAGLVELLEPAWVVGIGRFATRRAELALAGLELRIGTVLHPSPASPAANRGWEAAAREQLARLGVFDGCHDGVGCHDGIGDNSVGGSRDGRDGDGRDGVRDDGGGAR